MCVLYKSVKVEPKKNEIWPPKFELFSNDIRKKIGFPQE